MKTSLILNKMIPNLNRFLREQYLFILKISIIILSVNFLIGCGGFYQDNLYGDGHYITQEEREAQIPSQPDTTDYQAFQQNFVSISVDRMSFKLTPTLSQINVEGSCFNPGFQIHSIYFNAVDSSGSSIAHDGLAYSTNIRYHQGSTKLQLSNIFCSNKGFWSTVINVPTAILYKLNNGFLDVSMVVWHNGVEYHNDETGFASMSINPPPPEDLFSMESSFLEN